TVRMNPIIALTGFFINLTVLSAWVAHVGLQRKDALQTISRLQAEENQRLTEKVAQQTEALNKALKYAGEKNRQQTQIVGYVSHDLRAPLATVTGYLKILQQTALKEQKPHLDAIARSVDYQLTLIDEILNYTTAELKPLSLRPIPTALAAYLDEITQHATVLSQQQGNQFVVSTSHRLPKTVWLDGHRLRQVLLNLLSNAAKFTRSGTIRLDIRAVKRENDWRLHFIVSDSGIGIDDSGQAYIFEAFKQGEPSSAGVGLGLYIAQSILRGMDSELCVDSAQGHGSAFSFEISVPTADNQTIHWTAPATLPFKPGSAHVVESDLERVSFLNGDATAAIPPAHDRTELAIMARDGHLTDIEQWLQSMSARHPLCSAYFGEVRDALARLDFLAIERLALAQPEKNPIQA
ncbi:MAG TPA: HAMP domain-containing sensor histidine kinase, partial [Burkholderiaceae bacterium]|nr:HAMP domain-containing sensor histidine kinase [Burkholderiaceae bacterium]